MFNEGKTNIEIVQHHNEGKENSLLNGAIFIITDKQSIEELVGIIKNKMGE